MERAVDVHVPTVDYGNAAAMAMAMAMMMMMMTMTGSSRDDEQR